MPPPNIRPQKDGAVVQFYAYQTGRNGFIESNVFRYWKGREGLYSVQFARRSPLSSLDGNKAKDLDVVLASLKLASLVFRLPLALADGVFNRLKPLQRF